MALLQPLSMGQSDTHVDVIFSGDVDMLGTLPACALPVRGDLLELNDKTYLVVQRRWIMEGGRRTAVNLQLKDSYRLGKLFESQKDTATP